MPTRAALVHHGQGATHTVGEVDFAGEVGFVARRVLGGVLGGPWLPVARWPAVRYHSKCPAFVPAPLRQLCPQHMPPEPFLCAERCAFAGDGLAGPIIVSMRIAPPDRAPDGLLLTKRLPVFVNICIAPPNRAPDGLRLTKRLPIFTWHSWRAGRGWW